MMTKQLLKNRYFTSCLILTFLLISLLSFGQPGSGAGGNPGGGGAPPTPITGIEFLIGGGLLIGIKKSLRFFTRKK